MFIRIATLVSLLCIVACGPDYYSLLGLRHAAPEGEIKRAFKKLAVKYHPDRASESQRDEFSKKFAEISDAYTVLSDPELKNVYDYRGHDGLEDLRKQKDWQNQHKAQQEMHQSMVTDHFQNTDIQILNMQSLGRFYRRSGVWLVLFYRSQDREMQTGLKDAILDLNNKFFGIFTVAAVNCDQEEGICDEYRAVNTPDILGFTSDVNHDGTRYTGDKVTAKMAGFAVGLMQNFVSIVTVENIEEFLKDTSKIKMLVFSSKKESSPLMRALSKEFRQYIDIGHVKDNNREISRRFGIQGPPHILILKNDNQEVVHYTGEVSFNGVSDFIREHRDLSGKSKKKTRKLIDSKSGYDIAKNGCGISFKGLCVLVLYKTPEQKQAIDNELLEAFTALGDDPVLIQTLHSTNIDFEGLGIPTDSTLFVLKPSKSRLYSSNQPFTSQKLMDVMDLAVGGSLQFKSIKGAFSSYVGGDLDMDDL